MSTPKNRKKSTTATTAQPKSAKKARKSRAGLGMNNTWTDRPPAAETAEVAAPESATSEGPAGDAGPAEPAPVAEPVTSPEPPPSPTFEADAPGKKLSAIDAAAKVLTEEGRPMNCQEMIDAMAAKGYWQSPGGKTPAATLYSSILREQKGRGAEARFVKAARGKFTSRR
jgi:hypothetical protein